MIRLATRMTPPIKRKEIGEIRYDLWPICFSDNIKKKNTKFHFQPILYSSKMESWRTIYPNVYCIMMNKTVIYIETDISE